MNKISPFQLENFNNLIKTFTTFFIVGIILFLFSETNVQKERFLVFGLYFLFLLIIVLVWKKLFIGEKKVRLGLWLLYLSMLLASLGFTLFSYAIEDEQRITDLVLNSVFVIISSSTFFIVLKFIVKCGKKIFTENILAYIVFIPLLLVLGIPVLIINSDDFFKAFPWIGIFYLTLTIGQYSRINAYFTRSKIKRYHNLLNEKKYDIDRRKK